MEGKKQVRELKEREGMVRMGYTTKILEVEQKFEMMTTWGHLNDGPSTIQNCEVKLLSELYTRALQCPRTMTDIGEERKTEWCHPE